jgi:hypothetical protein
LIDVRFALKNGHCPPLAAVLAPREMRDRSRAEPYTCMLAEPQAVWRGREMIDTRGGGAEA